jgi:hypothetical protein
MKYLIRAILSLAALSTLIYTVGAPHYSAG